MGNIAKYMEPTQVVIGVCTRLRPCLLRQCLASILEMEIPESCAVSVVLVDNADEPLARGIAADFNCKHVLPTIRYVHEPRQGISHARNAVLDAATHYRADWIAMIDDDQVVPPDWLTSMVIAQQETGADVVQGSVEYIYPSPLPAWGFPETRKHKWALGRESAGTNGVLFRATLASNGLRFPEDHALTGGEDRFFFETAHRAGAYIVRTPLAVARETLPATKLTFRAQVRRAFYGDAIKALDDRRLYGFSSALAGRSAKAISYLLAGAGLLLFTPFAFLGGARYGRRNLLSAARRLARVAGICIGFTGLARLEPYRTIHGE